MVHDMVSSPPILNHQEAGEHTLPVQAEVKLPEEPDTTSLTIENVWNKNVAIRDMSVGDPGMTKIQQLKVHRILSN